MEPSVENPMLKSLPAAACAVLLAVPLSAFGYAGQVLRELSSPVR